MILKKLLSVEPIHADRKGKTQVEVTLDLKLVFNTNAVLSFPPATCKSVGTTYCCYTL
ncbi:putative primase [Staphylococcus gallinarum]|uniref:Putative primase n=1 Tax=Staphylococcus gallinarum TaxID=1293 RepID=A0A380FC63_STAGA|nr:putative primase [Staphylococcus gallinarum]